MKHDKIDLLALMATDHKGGLDRHKFAKLIVRECMNVCREQRNPQNLNYKPSEQFAEVLRQHFGVEE